jgi:integrase
MVAIRLAALRFFYTKTLRRAWSVADTPYPKRDHRLPTILSQEEVAQLIDAACSPFDRTILMTLYATGARRAELTHLKRDDPVGGEKSYPIVWGGGHSYPMAWCYHRIVNGPEDNVWIKYRVLKEQRDKRRGNTANQCLKLAITVHRAPEYFTGGLMITCPWHARQHPRP